LTLPAARHFRRFISDGSNYLDPNRPDAVRLNVSDIGTASLMWGEVLLAAETGEALPPGVAFDADGNPP
jgi:hypothetical protein